MQPAKRWVLSKHAFTRCQEMNLTRDQLVDIINYPDVDFPNARGNRHAVRDGLSVVYNDEKIEGIIVSILVDNPDTYVPRAS